MAGFKDRSGPQRAVERLLDTVENTDAGKYRTVEAALLDAVQATYWDAALGGDLNAAELVAKISAQRAKLLGLNLPERLILAAESYTSDEFAATTARLLTDLGLAPTNQDAARPRALDASHNDTSTDNWTTT